MTTLTTLAALLAVEFFAIVYGAWLNTSTALRSVLLVNMVLIALFAPKLFDIGGFASNVGSIFYAAVFTIQCMIVRCWGSQAAIRNVGFVVTSMLMFYAISWLLGSMAAVGPHDQIFTAAVSQITNSSLVSTVASLMAFLASQFVLIKLLSHLLPTGWPLAVAFAVVVGQLVDSVIFYPIAFYGMAGMDIVTITAAGYATKIVCGLFLTPAYLYAVYEREGVNAAPHP